MRLWPRRNLNRQLWLRADRLQDVGGPSLRESARTNSLRNADRKVGLTLWWVAVFLSIGWILFFININTLTKNSAAILSAPLVLFSGLSAVMFLLLLVLVWRHNQSAYKRRYPQWERSFLCQRCGTLI